MAMTKQQAIRALGGTVAAAARRVGVTGSAISQWPDDLPPRLEDRVLAALAREHLRLDVLTGDAAPVPSPTTA